LGAEVIEPPDGSAEFGPDAWDARLLLRPASTRRGCRRGEIEQRRATYLGFRRRSLIDVRILGRAGLEEQDAARAQILGLAIDLPEHYRGEAALVLNGEQILMRATASTGVVFDAWEGFAEDPRFEGIVARQPQRSLDQPTL
jgi:hypothetical protein